MIYGIGCDLCNTARMAKSLGGPHGSTFAARVFGPAEREALGLSEGNSSPLSAHKPPVQRRISPRRKPSSKRPAPALQAPLRSVR